MTALVHVSRRAIIWLCLIVLLLPITLTHAQEKISSPGLYSGYSEPLYTEWVRTSQYVTVRDGTKLAVDIIRPSVDGVPVEEPLPVVWTHHRYHRAMLRNDGSIQSVVDAAPELQTLLSYGYVVAAVDVRGGGASFGTRDGEFTPQETQDAYDITEWLAVQPWSNGNIGMYGGSYLGITQYLAASTQPPHLKAIFPMVSLYDLYSIAYPGGVLSSNLLSNWSYLVRALDTQVPPLPVDEDTSGAMVREAVAQHQHNASMYSLAMRLPYRDGVNPANGSSIYADWSPSTYIDAINDSGVAVYTLGGWYDVFTTDSLLWYGNLTVPQKLLMTPWSHTGRGGFDLGMEHVRWFDYWLKGIDNGIMDEPPITYYVMGAPEGQRWRTASEWPLPEQQLTTYYFAAGRTGTVESVNDGLLTPDAPTADGTDQFQVDYTATTGTATRYTNAYGGQFNYPNMTGNDAKGLTYTTAPLDTATEITGHPVVHLWVTSTQRNGSFFAYLEEVNETGYSTYITEGVLRAGNRLLFDAPYNNFGLPFHSGLEADFAPLVNGEFSELVFDLAPTANIFDGGHRIRVTITGADRDNFETIHVSPPPTVTLSRSPAQLSYIVLPVIPQG